MKTETLAYFQTLHDQAAEFRRAQASLTARKRHEFPSPCLVNVQSERYRGFGVSVVEQDGTPADKLPVLLENGNVWWYPVEDCTKVQWSEVDRGNRRAYLKSRGYGLPTWAGPRQTLP